jgi:hypothetical protein
MMANLPSESFHNPGADNLAGVLPGDDDGESFRLLFGLEEQIWDFVAQDCRTKG